MIVINNAYLDRFYKTKSEYLYMVNRGIYLGFDKDTLEYKGLELFYIPFDYKSYEKDALNTLNLLISKGICEIRDE